MLMWYHWGLGIGHAYAHTAASTNSQLHSSFPFPKPPNSSQHGTDNYKFDVDDEVNEGGISDDSELLEFEPESESDNESHSVLGDYANMHGWDADLDGSRYYEFWELVEVIGQKIAIEACLLCKIEKCNTKNRMMY